MVPKSAEDLYSPDRVGRYPGPEEKAILQLASEFQRRESGPSYASVSWVNQKRAYEVFQAGGLIAVLMELHRERPIDGHAEERMV